MKKTALLFPGQGSQVVGMAKDFVQNFRQSALVFEEASDTIHLNLKRLCFEGPSSELTLTENLQPALFTAEAAMMAGIRSHADLTFALVAGHSLGEYSALHAAGALSLSRGVLLTRQRGLSMQKATPAGSGSMAAVLGLAPSLVMLLCERARGQTHEIVEPANFNAPGQIVIAGTVKALGAAIQIAKEDPEFKGTKTMMLNVSAPFHCSLMEPAQKEMAPLLSETKFVDPICPIMINATAEAVDDASAFARCLTDQITKPVLWEQIMKKLRDFDIENAIEVGPGKVLSGLLKRIDDQMTISPISTVDQMKEVLK